eukprot:gene972-567_t
MRLDGSLCKCLFVILSCVCWCISGQPPQQPERSQHWQVDTSIYLFQGDTDLVFLQLLQGRTKTTSRRLNGRNVQ